MTAFTGRATTDYNPPGGGVFDPSSLAVISTALAQGKNVTAITYGMASSLSTGLLVARHCYTVVSVSSILMSPGHLVYSVTLRNPWGFDNNAGDPTYGDPNDGLITISGDDFLQSMAEFNVN